MSESTGKFITVEGIEGVGKSTNIACIQSILEQHDISVTITREPGGTSLGEDIRGLLLGHKHDGMEDETELMLMFAARNEHIASVIKPALAKGQWVICDRFTDATYAYQGAGRGIDMRRISELENWVQGTLRPDLTLLLDVPVAIGLQRAGARAGKADRFEIQQQAFFERVRQCYLDRAQQDKQQYHIIDASLPLEAVQTQLKAVLNDYLIMLRVNC